MSKQETELQQLIQRYIEGKCSAEEKEKVQQWMETLNISDESVTAEDVQQLRTRIDRITQTDDVRIKRIHWPVRYMTAAAVLLCMAVASFFTIQNQQSTTIQSTAHVVERTFPMNVQRLRVYHNHGNTDRLIALADGTEVILTPHSIIHFLEDFESDNRQVTLCGKARFDVAKDASRPFSVITGDIHTTAIGTVFWVTHLQQHALPMVQLLSGKVAITQKSKLGNREVLAALRPGDTWDKRGLHVAPRNSLKPTAEPKQAAVEEVETVMLAFHHTPLKDVFAKLSAHFQTQFSYVERELEGMTFYGNYTDKIVLEDILKHIMLTHEISITYLEDTATYEVSIPSNHLTND